MQSRLKEETLKHLKQITESHREAKVKAGRRNDETAVDWSHFSSSETEVAKLTTQSLAAAERIAGRNSTYARQIAAILDSQKGYEGQKLDKIIGVILSLSEAVERDAIQSIEELVHGELFGDFLEMASYLQDGGYKDAAAVIAGSSLEAHLRQLCQKNGIDVNLTGSLRPKKADTLNAELAGKSAYNLQYQKSVIAWLDLRNKAAHGNYTEYAKEQVGLMIDGIRDFITRNPA